MKIIGFTHYAGKTEMLLKGDSSLLNNKKPFFIPDYTSDVRYKPSLVLRVSRLGRNVQERFASRYYDAVAMGADFIAYDLLPDTQAGSWTKAVAFDNAMAVGEFVEKEKANIDMELCMSTEEAIAQASRYMTIRQGDLIFIDEMSEAAKVHRDEVICLEMNQTENLYCKIK